jgi:hypothetical protein
MKRLKIVVTGSVQASSMPEKSASDLFLGVK